MKSLKRIRKVTRERIIDILAGDIEHYILCI